MATDTDTERKSGQEQEQEPDADPRVARARAVGQGDRGREMLEHVALGADLDDDEERAALDWLLGAPAAMQHDITVQFETPDGEQPVTFTVRQMDTRQIDKIEQRNLSQSTGRLDALTANCQIVAEATVSIRDGSGRSTAINSDEFLTVVGRDGEPLKLASSSDALEQRFRKQLGLIQGVASEIRRLAGYDTERVGAAQRRLVQASLG